MSRYAVLNGRIKQQLRELELEYTYAMEQAELAYSTQIDAYWIAAGFGLQGFYTGAEKIFEQIAQVVDESLSKQSERWHQELLEQMQVEVPGIRPPVLDEMTYRLMRNYLGFRHVVRNNYTHRLDPKLIENNVKILPDCYQKLIQAMDVFCQFLVVSNSN